MPSVPADRARAKLIVRDGKGDPRALALRAVELAARDEQLAFEVFRGCKAAVLALKPAEIDGLLSILHDWKTTDCFGSFVSGVAWREGVIGDRVIMRWTERRGEEGLWVRRAALVSTVALNITARGATNPRGEAARTLAVCERLVDDHADMIVKALSWALRELSRKDARAVREFVRTHEDRLAARVKREVRNKLTTGVKNPRRG